MKIIIPLLLIYFYFLYQGPLAGLSLPICFLGSVAQALGPESEQNYDSSNFLVNAYYIPGIDSVTTALRDVPSYKRWGQEA